MIRTRFALARWAAPASLLFWLGSAQAEAPAAAALQAASLGAVVAEAGKNDAVVATTVDVADSAPAPHGSEGEGHRASFLGLNWWAWDSHRPPMGWFLLDFGIFVGLLAWASNKPLKRVFSARHDHVKRTIAAAAQAHAKASHAHHDIRRRLAAMEAEIRELENTTVADGEAERAQMVGAAESYAARLRAESQRQSDQQVRRSEEHLRRRVLAQVIRTAERKVQAAITPADHVRLVNEAIDRLASQGPKSSTRMAKKPQATEAKP